MTRWPSCTCAISSVATRRSRATSSCTVSSSRSVRVHCSSSFPACAPTGTSASFTTATTAPTTDACWWAWRSPRPRCPSSSASLERSGTPASTRAGTPHTGSSSDEVRSRRAECHPQRQHLDPGVAGPEVRVGDVAEADPDPDRRIRRDRKLQGGAELDDVAEIAIHAREHDPRCERRRQPQAAGEWDLERDAGVDVRGTAGGRQESGDGAKQRPVQGTAQSQLHSKRLRDFLAHAVLYGGDRYGG